MTSYFIPILPWLLIITTAFYLIRKVVIHFRSLYNRKAYSTVEKFALLNIVTFGEIFGLMGVYSYMLTFFFEPFLLIVYFFVPIMIYVVIISWGKKIKEVESDCQESTEQIATHNGNR